MKLFSLKEEGDWLINPSRYDPRQLTSQSTTGTSKNTKDLVKITGNGSRRVACLSFGIVKSCNLSEAAEISGSGSGKIVKSINLGLFIHEQWEWAKVPKPPAHLYLFKSLLLLLGANLSPTKSG